MKNVQIKGNGSEMENYDYLKVLPYQEEHLDVAEKEMWVLDFQGKKQLKVNTLTKDIIALFNGKSTLIEISEKLENTGLEISKDELIEFVNEVLLKHNILEGTEKKKEIRLSFRIRIPLVEESKLYFMLDRIAFLYNRHFAYPIVFLCVLIQLLSVIQGDWSLYIKYKNAEFKPMSIIVCFFIGTIFHELGHAAAARYYKSNVGKIGIGLYLFMPVAYTDLSSIWNLERKKRIVVNLGGFYFSLLYTSVIWIMAMITGNSNFRIVNILILLTMFFNLNPLLRMDGYWILCDYVGIVNLNKKVYDFMRHCIRKVFGKTDDFQIDLNVKKRKVYLMYFSLYLIANLIAIIVS